MRALSLCLLAVSLAACSGTSGPPAATEVADRDAVLSELRDEVAAVAQGQADADAAVNDVLDVVRAVDEAVVGVRQADTIDPTLSGYVDGVHARVEDTRVDGLREGYLQVAAAVDDARQTLAAARGELDDPWEQEYLDAQDDVLLAVRDYARTADRLAQLLVQHWPTYVEVDARIAEVAAGRDNYRDAQEATDALAVELDTVLDDLGVAEAQIAEYRAERTAAGQAVNDASADAVAVYERRPAAVDG